jgi:hypothetical protein
VSAIQATVSKFMSLADGTLRLQVDIHQTDTAAALSLLCEVGRTVAVAALQDVEPDELTAEGGPMQPMGAYQENECDNNAGKLMQALYRGGWFHAPKVLQALGKDAMFLQWCRGQAACWHCDGRGLEADNPIVAAHYRKVAAGAGTGIKPPYSAIPLCKLCHDEQHAQGCNVIAPAHWWEEKVAKARQDWGHERMRSIFETTSMTAVPAKYVVEWALEHELQALIPHEYLA